MTARESGPAPTSQPAAAKPPPYLTNSQRYAYKATYAPAKLPDYASHQGRALQKAAFLQRLGITSAELDALRNAVTGNRPGGSAPGPQQYSTATLDLAAHVTRAGMPTSMISLAAALASTSHHEIVAIGRSVAALRSAAAAMPGPDATQMLADQTKLLVTAFEHVTPGLEVGALHLERIEMTPAGVERGELVHSVPMTPGETVNISHKEWTVTTQTFESIVTDSFEGFSETGVTDKTDLSQATDSETRHNTSLDIGGSVTATFKGTGYEVTAAAKTDYSDKNDVHNTAKASVAHAVAVTRRASARTRKEHKTSFKVSSVAGAEDLAVRTLKNTTDHAIRVDYFQLIRKWRADLIRYGLRLTYDLVIPNPGVDLISMVLELQKLEETLSTASLDFPLLVTDVTPDTYLSLAAQYGATVDKPDDEYSPWLTINEPVPQADQPKTAALEFAVPDGYSFYSGWIEASIHNRPDEPGFTMLGFSAIPAGSDVHDKTTYGINLATGEGDAHNPPAPGNWFHGFEGDWGKIIIEYTFNDIDNGQIQGRYQGKLRPETLLAWQLKTWGTLRESAQANFDRGLTLAKDRKAFLQSKISDFDALTLRRMEHEEVMKWVLEWLLPSNPLTQNPVSALAIDWPEAAAAERPGAAIPLYRLESSTYGDHFYTHSAAERDNAILQYGYHDEGVSCFVYADSPEGTVPLYRALNTNNGHRLYTISQAEYNAFTSQQGITGEGIACYVYPVQNDNTVPLHRLYNQGTGDRLYTISDAERDQAIALYGYSNEDPAGFVYPPEPTAAGRDVEGIEAVAPGQLSPADKMSVLRYGDMVRFLHDAVEWENMLFFVYPYFWDDTENWPFKQFLMHPDPVHREFLRGGAARVVLTVRPGYEDAFVRFMELGPDATDQQLVALGKYPYITLGQELRNQALTNYENIPPANPDPVARPLLYAIQRAAWNDMQTIIAVLEMYNTITQPNAGTPSYPSGPETGLPGRLKQFLNGPAAGGLVVTDSQGNPVLGPDGQPADTWAGRLWKSLQLVPVNPGGNFDDPNATFTDPWGNPYHYTVSSAATPVRHGDYELVCYGSDNQPGTNPNDPLTEDITSWAEGLRVATWFDYTPTSAMDVSVDTTMPFGGPALPG